MATANGFLLATLVVFCLAGSSYGFVRFSSLKNTLHVTATLSSNQVLKTGVDNITVTWGVNRTLTAGTDSSYKKIKVQLCYAPISQKDRAWRKLDDDLDKDKTCQFKIVSRPYSSANNNESYTWTIERDVPSGTYFVRAYALDSDDNQVGYGQSTNHQKTTNLFQVQAISGRHVSLDIASVCFSVFSVVSLFFFFYIEKRKAKKSESK